jgi:hypothetical protein
MLNNQAIENIYRGLCAAPSGYWRTGGAEPRRILAMAYRLARRIDPEEARVLRDMFVAVMCLDVFRMGQ